MTDCNICCLPFTTKLRKCVECNYCKFPVCLTCVKTYITSLVNEVTCMNPDCGKAWSPTFISDNLPKSFINGEMKKTKESVLFEYQKSLLPVSQAELEQHLQKKKLIADMLGRNKYIIERNKEITHRAYRIRYELKQLNHPNKKELKIKKRELLEEKRQILLEKRKNNATIWTLRNGGSTERVVKEFKQKCPMGECNGYLSTQWKCGICEKFICKDCREEKIDDHTCDQDTVETVKLLKKDSKPCPGCGFLIHKIEGCNQMFCTQCHVAFDWKTCQIVTSRIHNPHYYEWQRNGNTTAREHGDEICGGLPNINHLYTIGYYAYRTTSPFVKDPYNMLFDDHKIITKPHRFLRHARHEMLPRFLVVDNILDNQDLRFKFLQSEITEKRFKQTLFMREKRKSYNREMYNLTQMFVDVGEELFRKIIKVTENHATNVTNRLQDTIPTCKDRFHDCLKEMDGLVDYFNSQSLQICERFNYKGIQIYKENKEWIEK